ncbi:MAG: hypothetical protein IIY21_26930 [Clostridiales bacterium]|nr:hypothetical protein [Clostridiales bacterium]
MNKQTISFIANEQKLERTSGECHYSSHKVSYIEAHFELGTNWSGFDSVSAVWFSDSVEKIKTIVDTDGLCIVPHELLVKKGTVRVNLVGSISSEGEVIDRLTTYPAYALMVDADAMIDGSETSPITPSQFEQFAEAVKADADRAEVAKDSAREYSESASESASSASTSAENALNSALGAKESEDNAKESEDNAEAYKNQAQEFAEDAETSADRAEQASATAGYMFFHIDERGHLIYERTPNTQVDFYLENGHLYVRATA